jgi:hypothetical protein
MSPHVRVYLYRKNSTFLDEKILILNKMFNFIYFIFLKKLEYPCFNHFVIVFGFYFVT